MGCTSNAPVSSRDGFCFGSSSSISISRDPFDSFFVEGSKDSRTIIILTAFTSRAMVLDCKEKKLL